MDTDMTKGSPYAHLIKFTIPMFIGQLCQLLYTAIDTLVVGRYVGVTALAALGAAGAYCFLIVGFGQGLAMGFGILVSQRYGAKDAEGLRKTYAMSIICAVFATLLLTVIAIWTCEPLLRVLRTPEDVLLYIRNYLWILYGGLIAVVFYNLFSMVLRAVGDSKSPLWFLLIASILNIILDLAFVLIFHWGVIGVGIATVIAQAISAVLTYIYIDKRYASLRLRKEDFRMDYTICRRLYGLGIPGALQNSVCAVGVIAVQLPLNALGTDAIASFALGNRVEGFLMTIYPCLGNSIATYAGQNYGAGNYKRIKKGFEAMCVITLVCIAVTMLLGLTMAHPFCAVFLSEETADPSVLEGAVTMVRTISWWWLPLASIFVFRTGAQGLGNGAIPLWSSLSELVARVIAAITLPQYLGFMGIILTDPISWITAGILCPVCWAFLMKKIKRELTGSHPDLT